MKVWEDSSWRSAKNNLNFYKKANGIVIFCPCAHACETVCELTVIEPFGIGEKRFVSEQAVVGLRQLFQIHGITASVA